MTLRARLLAGLLAIAVVFLVPLIVAQRSLNTLEEGTRFLRDSEFAASLVLGRLRGATEDVRAAETALLFVHDPASKARADRDVGRVAQLARELARYDLAREAAIIERSVGHIRSGTAAEYAAASSGQPGAAERASIEVVLPALAAIERTVRVAETELGDRTAEHVEAAAQTTVDAQRTLAASLAIAALLSILVSIWLLRSISTPMRDLEHGMKAVASGDFAHRLPFGSDRRDEFGRLAGSYESMAHQLADLDKLKAEFISIASHELKTPINVIIGYLELLREGIYGELAPKQLEITRTLEKQAHTLTRLVRQLLDVSRFEAGGGKIEPRKMDLYRFINNLESTFQVLAVQRGVAFTVSRTSDLPVEVWWDEDRINEVLGNLLSNAFKFTPRGGSISLSIGTAEDSTIAIQVRDTGAGIPPAQLPHIFEKFYQADNQAASAVKGTGLGLAIAKQILDAHRGTISVQSTENVGTTFDITLPIRVVSTRSSGRTRSVDLASLSS